jgi:hypothetical protein
LISSLNVYFFYSITEFIKPNFYLRYQTVKAGVDECDTEYEFPVDPQWEVDRSQLRFHSVLGEGQFGRVKLADMGPGDGGQGGGERGQFMFSYKNFHG